MNRSIRLRFVDRLESICNHAIKQIAQKLRGPQAHSNARRDDDFWGTVSVLNSDTERQGDDAAALGRFRDLIHEGNGNSRVFHSPLLSSDRHRLAARNHDLIAHQENLQKNYLRTVLAEPDSVESSTHPEGAEQ